MTIGTQIAVRPRPTGGGFLRRLWHHRYLVLSMVRRQYQIRYRQSLGGFAWAIVPPLATLATATLVFHKVAGVTPKGMSYAMFTFSVLAPWTFFANGLTHGIPSVVTAMQMVTRIPFPRAALPLGMIGTSFVDLGISSVIFVTFAYATGNGLPLTALWAFPLLAIELVLICGVVMLGSAINVFARDVRLAVPLIAQLWLFLTPVMYPLDDVPDGFRWLYTANPMTGLIESFRNVLVSGDGIDVGLLGPTLIGAAALFLIGSWYFAATERRFADVI